MIQNKLIKQFNLLFEKNHDVDSAILIGSFGRGNPKANSDIDYQILVSESFNREQLLDEIQTVISDNLKYFIYLQQKNKWCFYLTDDYIVVEVFICYNSSELNKYFLGSEIDNPKNAIIFDKTGRVLPYLTKQIKIRNIEFENIQKDIIESLIIDFVNRFESCSSAHSKSDGYKFNVLYSHAVNTVVRLIYHCEGGIEHEYMPPNFLTNFSYDLKLGIEKLGTMDMQIANIHKRELLNLFKKYLPIAIQKYRLQVDDYSLINFLENIYSRDFFWNFRDVSKFNPKIKRGLIYRSSALCLYKNTPDLDQKLKLIDITTIIDLRADRELREVHYDEEHQNKYKIIHAPFDPWNQSIDFQNTHNSGTNAEVAYYFFSKECNPSIKLIVETILASMGAINIHCHAGKDRTGIVISIFHLLSGADNDIILLDYLASEMDTKEHYLKIFLTEVYEKGGIDPYLIGCGLSQSQVEELKSKILNGN